MPAVATPSPARRPYRRARALAGLLLALVVGPAVLAAPAAAHNDLMSSAPGADAQVPTAPESVTLTFNDEVLALGSQIVVTGPDGSPVTDGELVVEDAVVTQPLAAARPAGTYQVTWRVVSADGHPISGEFSFTADADAGDGGEQGAADDAAQDSSEAPTTDSAQDAPTQPAGVDTDSGAAATAGISDGTKVAVFILIALAVLGGVAATIVRMRRNGRP